MHTPPDMSLWTGRDDTALEGSNATRIHQCIKPWTVDSPPGVCLLGFACDEGVRRNQGRVGAAEGPTALRKALANLAWSNEQRLYDAGDVQCIDGKLESAQDEHATVVAKLLGNNQRVISLGGGHETAWGSFLGLANAWPHERIGIVNLDAHFDLRKSPVPHSGTAFHQMAEWHCRRERQFKYLCLGIAEPANSEAIWRTVEELHVDYLIDSDLAVWDNIGSFDVRHRIAELECLLNDVNLVYLSVDLDVLPGWVMPAVSAPAANGVRLETVESVLGQLADSGKLAVADIVEFNPQFDRDGLAAKTAARLIWTLAKRWLEAIEIKYP